jgi:hypothetical protein
MYCLMHWTRPYPGLVLPVCSTCTEEAQAPCEAHAGAGLPAVQ